MITNRSGAPFRGFNYRRLISETLLLFFVFALSACNAQAKKENLLKQPEDNTLLLTDTLNTPKVNVKVNRQYDKDGKLIRFDSTYSYVYKGNAGNQNPMSNDLSLIHI